MNRGKIWKILLLSVAIIGVVGCGAYFGWQRLTAPGMVDFREVTKIDDKSEIAMETIYSREYQDNIHEEIEELKAEEHTLQNPLAISDPYGTSTTGIYVFFETFMEAQITYTISAEGYEDYTQIIYNEGKNGYSKTHETMLIGCIPEVRNEITLEARNKWGLTIGTCTFLYDAPALGLETANVVNEVEKGESTQKLAEGLYVAFGNDNNEEDTARYTVVYDNNGVARMEIPVVSYRAHRFLFDSEGMWFSVSRKLMVCMNQTGFLSHIYDLGKYNLHHDYKWGSKGDMIILATNTEKDTEIPCVEDEIIIIDKVSGEITGEIDLVDIFPDYYEKTKIPSWESSLDWMHLNSMELVDEDSIIISSRETSSIIRLDNIYDEVQIGYIISSKKFWEGTPYEQYVLDQEGEFSLQGGQHYLTVVRDDELEEDQYYITMYNNNNMYTSTIDYDYSQDGAYYNMGNDGNEPTGNPSYYYKYLVDEEAGTFQLVDSIPVGYSGYVSSAQPKDGNMIIDSGRELKVYEFDQNNELIQTIQLEGSTVIYRILKYDFKGFWFQ